MHQHAVLPRSPRSAGKQAVSAILCLSAGLLGSWSAARAATYSQTTFNPATTTWNGAAIWGGNAVTSGNDYQMAVGPTLIETTFTVTVGSESTPWAAYAQVRDYGGTGLPSGPSTFAGSNLLIAGQTRFLSKARNTTTTANFTLQNGGYMFLSAGGVAADGPGTAKWAGTLSTTGSTLIGLEATNNTGVTTLDVDASITGSGTLTLTGKGANSGFLNLNGDISGFTGTFLLSSATNKTTNSLTFSIVNSAALATLQLNWESPLFRYNLADHEVSFASLILGTDTVLAPGTYDADDLNGLTGNGGIFSGTGTITVVPEPGAPALAAVAALAVFVLRRRL